MGGEGWGKQKDGKEKIKKKMITNKTEDQTKEKRRIEPKRSGCQPKVRWAGGRGGAGRAGQEGCVQHTGLCLAHSRS